MNVDFELNNGEIISMKMEISDYWSDIKENTRAIMNLINGVSLFVSIQSACEDEGVAFKIINGENTCYHYESTVINSIYVELD
jgi:hypothetical protein